MIRPRKNSVRAFVAMSGGVDSSVAALLLKREGYDAVGVFMRCYNVDGCAEQDAADARRVAERIGIPFYAWDFEEEYKRRVVDYMIRGYKEGITPNPDVMCNREIKFGLFYERAMRMGADFVATGHYVRLRQTGDRARGIGTRARTTKTLNSGPYVLSAARDKNKDQSYFLWTLTPEKLAHCLFPIGEYVKPEVRAIARRAELPTAGKKDSQGICFLGQISLDDFLGRYLRPKQGEIRTVAGEVIGTHRGSHFYTIGQRHGLRLDVRRKEDAGVPYYVAEKDARANTLTVAPGNAHPALYKTRAGLADVNWTVPAPPAAGFFPVFARVRYRQPLAKATIKIRKGTTELSFEKPQKFVAPGQSAVWYGKNGALLGGGVILTAQ